MPERGYTAFHKPIVAVYECIPQGIDQRCCCMGCVQAKAAPGNQSDGHDGHSCLDEPCSSGCCSCRSLSRWKKLPKILAQPKTCGNKMKRPVLSSFCPSGFRSAIRFLSKILVPEIPNLLTLVVRNCTENLINHLILMIERFLQDWLLIALKLTKFIFFWPLQFGHIMQYCPSLEGMPI